MLVVWKKKSSRTPSLTFSTINGRSWRVTFWYKFLEFWWMQGDQASIVGGAIMFVKELEHLLQSLEAQKLEQKLLEEETQSQTPAAAAAAEGTRFMRPPFSQFFVCPQYTWLQLPSNNGGKYSGTSSSPSSSLTSSRSCGANGNDNGNGGGVMAAIADIEVTLIETHANLRILSRRSPRQLLRLVAGFHTLQLSILHLNVTTLHPLVLYSISAKVWPLNLYPPLFQQFQLTDLSLSAS